MSDTLPKLTKADLFQFTGSEHWYRHALVRHITFTDGAKYVADAAGAYWLLDDIAFAQLTLPELARDEFQLWRLTVKPDHTATLACENGNGKTVHARTLTFTDFPLPEIVLYFVNNVIHLPSEY